MRLGPDRVEVTTGVSPLYRFQRWVDRKLEKADIAAAFDSGAGVVP